MSGANWRNRTLFHGDNLAVLRAMDSGTVDLIATAVQQGPRLSRDAWIARRRHAAPGLPAHGTSLGRAASDQAAESRWLAALSKTAPAGAIALGNFGQEQQFPLRLEPFEKYRV